MGAASFRLKIFRCRMRAMGATSTVECIGPSPEAAAYVVGQQGLQGNRTPWVQVVVAEWSGVLGEFVDPGNALMVSHTDAPPAGAELVVFSRVEFTADPPQR
jgi:hypothetical protein